MRGSAGSAVRLRGCAAAAGQTSIGKTARLGGEPGGLAQTKLAGTASEVWRGVWDEFRNWLLTAA
jgi:hypothetical protein